MTKNVTSADVLAEYPASTADATPRGAVTATLVGFNSAGLPLVEAPLAPRRAALSARSSVSLGVSDVGKQVVVVVDEQNPDSPIIIGIIQPAVATVAQIVADGRDVVVSAEQSITLKCGEASITLQRDGRIVIRGKHVVTHATGVNRIRGGSVQLN